MTHSDNPLACALWVALIFAGLLALAAALLRLAYRHPLPRRQGRLSLPGLREPVTLYRDDHGYLKIEATSLHDAVFAQGFGHAQDRLWQMELNRRVGSGRLSEIFGERAVAADLFVRRLGLRRAAQSDLEHLDPLERELLEAYAAGVQAARQAMGWRLPIEFRLLGFSPEPWTVLDSLTWIQVMSMDLCGNWEQELLRARILQRLGPRAAAFLHADLRGQSAPVPSEAEATDLFEQLRELYQEARGFLPNSGLPGGSNAWVVSGHRSASGKPLLANDPHLVGRVPGIWYEVHLQAPGLDVQGASFPGLPFVVIGHNRQVAWGITNSYADTQDLYLERFHPDASHLVETEQGYQPVTVFEEVIAVKDRAPVVEQVELTRHGPILVRSDWGALALRWVNYEPSHPVATLLAMNQAQSAGAFKEALRTWQAPSSNFVFADVSGQIGYLMAGRIPRRRRGTGLVPVPGWSGEWEWEGTIPFEELPQSDNPPCGYIVTANNAVVKGGYPYHLSWDWLSPARADRIEQLLQSRPQHTVADFATMQCDVDCSTGRRLVAALQGLAPQGKAESKVLEVLRAWDGDGGANSAGMAVYQVLLLTTQRALLEPLLGPSLCADLLGASQNPLSVMAGHAGRSTAWFLELLEHPERFAELEHPQPLEEVLQRGLGEATRLLETRLGPDPTRWRWGRLHRLVFQHGLGSHRWLGLWLNSPVIESGGDSDTIMQTAVIPHQPFTPAWCPSWRQVVDLAEPERAATVLPTGQSGHPASSNYMDQLALWRDGRLRPHPTDYRYRLRLEPLA